MSLRRTRAENLALSLLAHHGIAAIWLTPAAAAQDRSGSRSAGITLRSCTAARSIWTMYLRCRN